MSTKEILTQLDQLFAEGKIKEAENYLDEQALLAKREGNSALLLTLLNEQEGIYRNTGRAEKAADCGEQALELIEAMGLIGEKVHAVTLINTATAHRIAGNLEKALSLYRQSDEILSCLPQPDGVLEATCMNNLSQVYQELKQHEEALTCLKKAYDLISKSADRKSEKAITAQNMALSLMALKRLSEANDYLEEAGRWFTSDPGLRDRHIGSYYSALAEYFFHTGEKEKARETWQKALDLTRSIYGYNDACRRIEQNIRFGA